MNNPGVKYSAILNSADNFLSSLGETLISVDLTLPNSWNSLYGLSLSRKMYLKPKGRQYKAYASELISKAMEQYKVLAGTGRKIFIVYNLYLSNARFWDSDFDNRLKILNDAIESSGLVENDSLILGGLIVKRPVASGKAFDQHIILQVCEVSVD